MKYRQNAHVVQGVFGMWRIRANGGPKGQGMATFLSPMAATGLSTPTSAASRMPRVWRAFSAQSRVLSSTGCSLVSPARPFWRVRKEFALLSGSDAAAFQGETE